MRVVDIPRGLRRVGKLRMGAEVEASNGKTRPTKLDTWRLTSPDPHAIDEAALAYGGTPQPWDNDGNPEFEVFTDSPILDVLLTPEDDSFSQAYELWTAGGCSRRCDGQTETLSGEACKCPLDREQRSELAKNGKACKLTTRLSVVLPKVAALGSWMVESHGFYAAKELASTIDLLDMAGARRGLLPARLRIEQRTAKRDGKTNRYGVPVLDIGLRLDDLLHGELPPSGVNATTGEIQAPAPGSLAAADQQALPPADPVTSTKRAEARKEAAKTQSVIQAGADMKSNDPMPRAQLDGFIARINVLEPEQVAKLKAALDGAGIPWGAKRKVGEAKKLDEILLEVEGIQAGLWEDRRVAVASALPAGMSPDDRHALIAAATEPLGDARTESMKTLTQAQANAILDHLEELAIAAAGEQQTIDGAAS